MKKAVQLAVCGLITLTTLLSFPAIADDYFLTPRLDTDPGFQYHPSPSDWRDVNMYQLFTDRFFDGNPGNNNVRGWYTTEGYRHYAMGGDWAGVRQKLDYLQGMGVNCIWISGVQINEQGTDTRYAPYHAYHPTDFFRVEPMFGTFQELKDLIDDAHSRGIYIVLDVVVNHMADLAGLGGGKDDYYHAFGGGDLFWWNGNKKHAWPLDNLAYFHNNGKIKDWNDYWQVINGAFVGTDDLKTEDPFVASHLHAAFKNLIDATDCDGFRVDAIKHMEKPFIMDWADAMRQHAAWRGKTNFILFGENFNYDDGAVAEHCRDVGYAFNSALYFPLQGTMQSVFNSESATRDLTSRRNNLHLYGEGQNNLVAFLDNHDVNRFSIYNGNVWEQKLKPALTYLYTATPVPCLFYGTEHGFNQGGQPNNGLEDGDYQRECMMNYGYQPGNAWGDKFYASSVYNYIAALNSFRRDYPCLTRGDLTVRWEEGSKGLYAYTRVLDNQEGLVVFNTDWVTKSAQISVGKPDGTVFVNLFNPEDTLTVSGGKLNVSTGSKESKIYMAGGALSGVETRCTLDDLIITYTPGGGPLENAVGSIRIGLRPDDEIAETNFVMTLDGSSWTFAYPLDMATNGVTFWFYDESTPDPVYDNNDGENYSVVTLDCWKTGKDLAFVGNVSHWPPAGEIDPAEDVWVDVESWPQGAAITGLVRFSDDNGATWRDADLMLNGTQGNNDAWHANLGPFARGRTVLFSVMLFGDNGEVWNDNEGANFSFLINTDVVPVEGVENTYHWPLNGDIDSTDDVWINTESRPKGAGFSGKVVYSYDGGSNWLEKALNANGTNGTADLWNVNLGRFPAESTIRYAVMIADEDGVETWDNNGGADFTAAVNASDSSLQWFGRTRSFSVMPPDLILGANNPGEVRIAMNELRSGVTYSLCVSSNLIDWTAAEQFTALSAAEERLIGAVAAAEGGVFYCLRIDYGDAGTVVQSENMIVNIETYPAGGAAEANIVFSADGGGSWLVIPMVFTGKSGDNDAWTANLGTHPAGTVIQYAVEVKDSEGRSMWDNNESSDYRVSVVP